MSNGLNMVQGVLRALAAAGCVGVVMRPLLRLLIIDTPAVGLFLSSLLWAV